MNDVHKLDRREFLKVSALVGSGLILGFPGWRRFETLAVAEQGAPFAPNVFLAVTRDDRIRILCHRAEMGQGAHTSMPMLIAEELEVDWKNIDLVPGYGDKKFGDQNTDGSTSVRLNWIPLREAGASAREMLITAAAETWGVKRETCYAKEGFVYHKPTKKKLSYGALAEKASTLPVPKEVKLKAHKDFKVIGKPKALLEAHDITTGKAKYGIDGEVPGMVYASLVRSPTEGGRVKDYDDSEAKKVPGVRKIIKIAAQPQDVNTREALAVIGDHTYAGIAGCRALKVEWDAGKGPFESTDSMRKDMEKALAADGNPVRSEGDVKKGAEGAKKTVNARYFVPYLAHATMEPPNAVAHVHDGQCDVWAPTQDPQRARRAAAKFLGVDESKVAINQTLLGGGFGRKSQPDFILEAVSLSKELGKPVKLTWTRENDTQNGYYHAISMQDMTAHLDEKGMPKTWIHKSSFPTVMKTFNPAALDAQNFEVGQGQINMPYRIPNVLCSSNPVRSQLNIGWLRAVCNIFHAFGVNSFIDEIAYETKQDPVSLRLKLLGEPRVIAHTDGEKAGPFKQETGRLAAVIKKTASMSGWNKKKARKGQGFGFASHYSFFSYVALALEVKVENDQIKIVRIDCAADCGTVVNPDTVKAQLEGGILFGLSAAAMGEISVDKGAVVQSNFHDYPITRLRQAPKINVELIRNSETPTGIGEPGTPPLAPALASAIFMATGKRVRELPLIKQGFELV